MSKYIVGMVHGGVVEDPYFHVEDVEIVKAAEYKNGYILRKYQQLTGLTNISINDIKVIGRICDRGILIFHDAFDYVVDDRSMYSINTAVKKYLNMNK